MKRFVLVCNTSKGVYNTVTFKKENESFVFKKFSVNGFNGILKFNRKSTLLDIDKMTCSYKDRDELLKNLKIFDPIFGMFIGYPTRGYVNRISPVFGDVQLVERIEKFVVGDKVKKEEVDRIFNELVTNKDLYKLYMKEDYFKTKSFCFNIRQYMDMYEYISKGIEGDVTGELLYLKNAIKEDLSKYHLYRELFRATRDFKKLNEGKPKKNDTSNDGKKSSSPCEPFTSSEFKAPEAYQLKIRGF